MRELSKLTGHLGDRVEDLEKANHSVAVRLSKLKRGGSIKSTGSDTLSNFSTSLPWTRRDRSNSGSSTRSRAKTLFQNRCVQIILLALVGIIAVSMVAMASIYIINNVGSDTEETLPSVGSSSASTTSTTMTTTSSNNQTEAPITAPLPNPDTSSSGTSAIETSSSVISSSIVLGPDNTLYDKDLVCCMDEYSTSLRVFPILVNSFYVEPSITTTTTTTTTTRKTTTSPGTVNPEEDESKNTIEYDGNKDTTTTDNRSKNKEQIESIEKPTGKSTYSSARKTGEKNIGNAVSSTSNPSLNAHPDGNDTESRTADQFDNEIEPRDRAKRDIDYIRSSIGNLMDGLVRRIRDTAGSSLGIPDPEQSNNEISSKPGPVPHNPMRTYLTLTGSSINMEILEAPEGHDLHNVSLNVSLSKRFRDRITLTFLDDTVGNLAICPLTTAGRVQNSSQSCANHQAGEISVNQRNSSSFDLDLGDFVTAQVMFRRHINPSYHVHDPETLCNLHSDHLGFHFREFNINFIRQCYVTAGH